MRILFGRYDKLFLIRMVNSGIIGFILYVLLGVAPPICGNLYQNLYNEYCLYCIAYFKIVPFIFFFGGVMFFILLILHDTSNKKVMMTAVLISASIAWIAMISGYGTALALLFEAERVISIILPVIFVIGSVFFLLRTHGGLAGTIAVAIIIFVSFSTIFNNWQQFLQSLSGQRTRVLPVGAQVCWSGSPPPFSGFPTNILPPPPPVPPLQGSQQRGFCPQGSPQYNLVVIGCQCNGGNLYQGAVQCRQNANWANYCAMCNWECARLGYGGCTP